LVNCNERRGTAGNGPGTAIKHLRRTTSGAAGNGLGTTATTSGAAGNGLGTTIKYLLGATGMGQGNTIKYLRRTMSAAAGIGLGTTISYPATHNERHRGQWPWQHDQMPATHNETRRGRQPRHHDKGSSPFFSDLPSTRHIKLLILR
jgi:hypothetical protein